MKKGIVALLLVLALLVPTGFATLTFGYHIVQIGQVAILMQEGIDKIDDDVFYYAPDDMIIFYTVGEGVDMSVEELYNEALTDISTLDIGNAEAESVELDDLLGGNYLDITYKPNDTYDKLKGCLAIHNGVMSAIMFASAGAKEETIEEFNWKVRDYVYTMTFLDSGAGATVTSNGASDEIEKPNSNNAGADNDENAVFDIAAYKDFDYNTLYRRPTEHIGDKCIISGRLCSLSHTEGSNDVGYDGLWLHYRGSGANEEYVLLWTDPLEFNLLKDDWLEVYGTIIGYGLLYEQSDKEVLYLHVDALNVYSEEGGSLIETTIPTE